MVLQFPAAPATPSLNNDIIGLTVDSMSFADMYTMNGQALAVASALDVSGGASVTISSGITLTSDVVMNVAASGTLSIAGAVSGTGGIYKDGPGTLALSGGNTYAGDTTVAAGTLNANSSGASATPPPARSCWTGRPSSWRRTSSPFGFPGLGGGGTTRSRSTSRSPSPARGRTASAPCAPARPRAA